MFAAYNGGPDTLEANLRGEEELPKETQNDLVSVTDILDASHRRTHSRGRAERRDRSVSFLVTIGKIAAEQALSREDARRMTTVPLHGPSH